MKTLLFDNKQPETTLSSTGRVLICVNEREVTEWEYGDEESNPVLVTKYEYDTEWVRPIKQTDSEILKAFRESRIAEVDAYDVSPNVNNITINGESLWLSVTLRSELKMRAEAELASGKDTSTIWYNGHGHVFTPTQVLNMLVELEIYASSCYDVTASHKETIEGATTLAGVGAFDVTAGYPDNPVFTL